MVIVPTTHSLDGFRFHKHSLDSKVLEFHSIRPKKPSRPHTFVFHDYFTDDSELSKKSSDDRSHVRVLFELYVCIRLIFDHTF